jgi:hypothetical protein
MNAALGGVSAGGLGTPAFEVTHRGGGPSAFVANQSAGNAGGVTPSKFSRCVIRVWHPQLPSLRASRGPTATAATMSRTKSRRFRNRVDAGMRFGFVIRDYW